MSTFGAVGEGVGAYNSSLSGNLFKMATKNRRININFPVIIIGALIFTIILSWFEFLRILFDDIFPTKERKLTPLFDRYENIFTRFIYSIFITCICIAIIAICTVYIKKRKFDLHVET